jgi:hypothetical protein
MVQASRVAINNFQIETQSILSELETYHLSKKRQIEHCFQKLFDNIPSQIINIPLNKCIDEYLAYRQEKENNKEAIISNDHSLNEDDINERGRHQDESNFHFDDAKDL